MFCSKCGAALADEAKFCPSCGQSTQSTTQSPAVTPRAPQTTAPARQISEQGASPVSNAQTVGVQQPQIAQNHGQAYGAPTPQQSVVRCANCGSTRVSIQQGKNASELEERKAKKKKYFTIANVFFVAGIVATLATGVTQFVLTGIAWAIVFDIAVAVQKSKIQKLEKEGSASHIGTCGDCGYAFPMEVQ